jgi:hypothetical protein
MVKLHTIPFVVSSTGRLHELLRTYVPRGLCIGTRFSDRPRSSRRTRYVSSVDTQTLAASTKQAHVWRTRMNRTRSPKTVADVK